MSVIEIIQFTTHPGTTSEALQQALGLLDRELENIGGFQNRTLYQDAAAENGWLLDGGVKWWKQRVVSGKLLVG